MGRICSLAGAWPADVDAHLAAQPGCSGLLRAPARKTVWGCEPVPPHLDPVISCFPPLRESAHSHQNVSQPARPSRTSCAGSTRGACSASAAHLLRGAPQLLCRVRGRLCILRALLQCDELLLQSRPPRLRRLHTLLQCAHRRAAVYLRPGAILEAAADSTPPSVRCTGWRQERSSSRGSRRAAGQRWRSHLAVGRPMAGFKRQCTRRTCSSRSC